MFLFVCLFFTVDVYCCFIFVCLLFSLFYFFLFSSFLSWSYFLSFYSSSPFTYRSFTIYRYLVYSSMYLPLFAPFFLSIPLFSLFFLCCSCLLFISSILLRYSLFFSLFFPSRASLLSFSIVSVFASFHFVYSFTLFPTFFFFLHFLHYFLSRFPPHFLWLLRRLLLII